MFYSIGQRYQSHKTFWRKFTCSFGKLDLFIEMQQTLLMFLKWSSFQESVCKFREKLFYEIDPQCQGATTLSIMTFIMTLGVTIGKFDAQHKDA